MRLPRYVLSPVCSSNAGTKKVATNSDANRLMMRTSENSLKVTFCLSPTKNTRESAPTVGYYAMFEYLNGFKKAIYWSKKKMLRHADKYSAAFSLEARPGKYPKVSYADYVAGNYDPKTEWLYSSF